MEKLIDTLKRQIPYIPQSDRAKITKKLFEVLGYTCKEYGYGDPYNYARPKEIMTALELGHTMAPTFSGADAYNEAGRPVEYKSTTEKKIKATYNGVSVQQTWPEQRKYLTEEKIGKYSEHYFTRFSDCGEIEEIWKASGADVLNLLLPKFKKQYFSESIRKDPRLGATLTNKQITTIGEKIR